MKCVLPSVGQHCINQGCCTLWAHNKLKGNRLKLEFQPSQFESICESTQKCSTKMTPEKIPP